MSKLEELLRQHRDEADYREPFPGHEQRFLIKAGHEGKQGNKSNYLLGLASIVAVMTIVVMFNGTLPSLLESNKHDLSGEMAVAVYYYENLSASIFKGISQIKETDKNEFNRLKDDLEASEKWKKLIMDDYKKFPDDERVRNALIEFHRNQAEMLSDIYEHLKNKEYETI